MNQSHVALIALGLLTLTAIILAFAVSHFCLYLAPSEQVGYWLIAMLSLSLFISWPKLAIAK